MAPVFDTPITTNDQSIDRVLATGRPVAFVFLDGGAPASLGEAMDRLARQEAGKMLLAQVQVKDNPASARRYSISRTPAVVTVRDGRLLTQAEGISAPALEQHVAYLLGQGPKPPEPRPASQQQASGGAARSTSTTSDSRPQAVTDATFDQEVLRSTRPVLVDFWAPWCGPCRITDPILTKMAGEMGSRLKIAKVNVDENPLLAQRYGVQSIPTMLFVRQGQVVDRWVGALPEPALRSRVNALL